MKALICNSIWSNKDENCQQTVTLIGCEFVRSIKSRNDCDRIYREMADTDVTQIGL
jgi:hypothetical protein